MHNQDSPGDTPARRPFPQRPRQPVLQELDEHGDVIFRFAISEPAGDGHTTLRDFYRESIYDLLKVVRLYAHGQPVLVDAFAFLNRPQELIPLLDEEARA